MVCPVLNIKPHVPPIIPIHLNFSRETFLAPFTDLSCQLLSIEKIHYYTAQISSFLIHQRRQRLAQSL